LVNNGQSGGGTFTFIIAGINPQASMVDSVTGYPWFFQNMVAWESNYRQYDTNGFPLVSNNRNGIGLTQLDPPLSSNDFWNWSANAIDGASVLIGKQSAAYASWDSEFQQMVNTTSGNPVYPPTTTYPYCVFQYPQTSGRSYKDGDWIHFYNGGYYIFWIPPANGNAGFWDIDTTEYVQHVCSTASK
jgi:hypothetical protein